MVGLDGKEKKIRFSKINNFLRNKINKTFTAIEILNSSEKGKLEVKKLTQALKKNIDFASERPEIKSFYGRESELKELAKFMDSNSKILSVKGIAGIGKTALITKAIENYKQKYNLFWHRVHEFSTPESMLRYLADFLLAMKEHRLRAYMLSVKKVEIIDALMVVEDALKNIDTIMVFDDIHKINKEFAEFLKEFLRLTKRIPSTKVILSGRWIPRIYDKKDVLDGLVKELTLEGLDKKATEQLLNERGIRKGINRIYSTTKGHPLLLMLVKSEKTVAEDVYSFLKDEVYDKLSMDEREILSLSSAFRFPFNRSVFLENNMSIDLVDELVDKSLMQRSNDIYDEHDLIRRFFYNRLSEREKIRYHRAAGEYYEKETGEQSVLESMRHYILADHQEKIAKTIIKNGEKLIKKGYLNELMSILKGLDLRRFSKHELVRIILFKRDIYEIKGEWDKCLNQAKSALKLAEELGNKRLIAMSYLGMARIYVSRANYDKAVEVLQKTLKMSKEINDAYGTSEVYYWLGEASWMTGKLDEAAKYLELCLNLSKKLGNERLQAMTCNDLGVIYRLKGNYKRALEMAMKCLRYFERTGDNYELAMAQNLIGATYAWMNDYRKAIEWYEKCMKTSMDAGFMRGVGYGLVCIAEEYAKLSEDLERAKSYVDEALGIFQKLGEKRGIGYCHASYAIIYRKKKEWSKASGKFEKCIKIEEEIGHLDGLSYIYREYARMLADKGDKDKAAEMYKKSITVYEKFGNEEKVKEIEKELAELEKKI
ncbi:MAG: tetratricopeptide repeat protein [Candidatus Thermoplasmatota archaeon]|nr:tetratricopeptide repeat protein [Candidatus Thermoplasmatota archaeon]